MVNEIVREVNVCLDNGCCIAGLSLALTLPDICGKEYYPQLGNKRRYIKWFNEYIGQFECDEEGAEVGIPYLSGELVYSLRCSLLHQGNPNIKENEFGIVYFELIYRQQEGSHVFCGSSQAQIIKDENGNDKAINKELSITEFKIADEKVYLSPVLDMYNREIVSYSISTSPNLQQIRDMLQGLFEKLPTDARPLFHSDQGWQYQHDEYQRLLAEHNITQSMSRKGNCMDNGIMENFFGRLKVEMYYGEKFESVNAFIDKLEEYIEYYNNERISLGLKGMSPVQYRTHSQIF